MPSIDVGRPEISVVPVRRRSAGDAIASRSAADRTVSSTGFDMTPFTSRAQKPLPGGRLARRSIEAIHRHAAAAGRDPAAIGLQSMVAPPPRDAEGKRFYAEPDRVVARVAALKAMGFGWVALNATAIFQAGARSVDAMLDSLGALHTRIRAEVG